MTLPQDKIQLPKRYTEKEGKVLYENRDKYELKRFADSTTNNGWTAMPNEMFEVMKKHLDPYEFKLAYYYYRQCCGFGVYKENENSNKYMPKRTVWTASLTEIEKGTYNKEGKLIVEGVSISRPTIVNRNKSLVKKNIIEIAESTWKTGSIPYSQYYFNWVLESWNL